MSQKMYKTQQLNESMNHRCCRGNIYGIFQKRLCSKNRMRDDVFYLSTREKDPF